MLPFLYLDYKYHTGPYWSTLELTFEGFFFANKNEKTTANLFNNSGMKVCYVWVGEYVIRL